MAKQPSCEFFERVAVDAGTITLEFGGLERPSCKFFERAAVDAGTITLEFGGLERREKHGWRVAD